MRSHVHPLTSLSSRAVDQFLIQWQLTPPYSYVRGIDVSNPYKFVEYHKWRFNGE
jgi:outer membrane protein insertion porin family